MNKLIATALPFILSNRAFQDKMDPIVKSKTKGKLDANQLAKILIVALPILIQLKQARSKNK